MPLVLLLRMDFVIICVCPRPHCDRTDLVMHVNTLQFTSPIQGDGTNRGVSCFRVFPRPLIDGVEELSTCAISLYLTYSVWLALPPTRHYSLLKSEWKSSRRLRRSGRWHRSAKLHASRPEDHNPSTQITGILATARTSDLIYKTFVDDWVPYHASFLFRFLSQRAMYAVITCR
jgi:hypothetical protein